MSVRERSGYEGNERKGRGEEICKCLEKVCLSHNQSMNAMPNANQRNTHDSNSFFVNSDGSDVIVRVEYQPRNNVVEIYLNSNLVLRAQQIDIPALLGSSSSAYIGFTSSTSSSIKQISEIKSFSFRVVGIDAGSTTPVDPSKVHTTVAGAQGRLDGEETGKWEM